MASETARSLHPTALRAWGPTESGRTAWLALAVLVLCTLGVVATAAGDRFERHTPYNHYGLLAEAWLHGRLDLGGPPPRYSGNNDFAFKDGKTYVSFPPAPALLLLLPVALAGRATLVRDGLWFIAISGVGPMLLFLALERLRRSGRGPRSDRVSAGLALLFGLGTVYWFSAAQGTVWFAAHVVAVACAAGFLLASVEARHPLLAGLALGLAVASRPTLLVAGLYFVYEAARAARIAAQQRAQVEGAASRLPAGWAGSPTARVALFVVPVALALGLLAWHNVVRFGDPFEFGHRFLRIAWRERIDKWGLFSTHYLGRNLGIMLGGMPFRSPDGPWQVNGHGLALWLTSPFLLWALWPRRTGPSYWVAAGCAAAIAAQVLLYQNSGWVQFGYRFSNDFALLLVWMIALGRRRLGSGFWLVGLFGVAVNAWGALSFGKAEYASHYFIDPSQRIVHEPD